MQQFYSLFRLSVQHDYYRSGRCPDLALVPLAGTQQAFRRYGLRYRSGTDSFELTGLQPPAGELAAPAFSRPPLRFRLEIRNPLFLHFTDLNLNLVRSHLYYLSNQDKNTPLAGAYLQDQHLLPYVEKADLAARLPEYRTVKLVNENQQAFLLRDKGLAPAAGEALLGSLPPGKYLLQQTGEKKKNIYLAEGQKEIGLLGYLDLFWPPTPPGAGLPAEYSLKFPKRYTTWRIFVNRSPEAWPQARFSITGEGQQEFTWRQAPDGQSDLFESARPLPLEESPSFFLQLRELSQTNKAGGKVIIDKLPHPAVASIKRDAGDRSRFFSDTYINV